MRVAVGTCRLYRLRFRVQSHAWWQKNACWRLHCCCGDFKLDVVFPYLRKGAATVWTRFRLTVAEEWMWNGCGEKCRPPIHRADVVGLGFEHAGIRMIQAQYVLCRLWGFG